MTSATHLLPAAPAEPEPVDVQLADVLSAGEQAEARRAQRALRRLWIGVLVQVGLCAGPAALLFMLGRAALGATVFWGLLGLALVRLVLLRRRGELLCLLIALCPMMNLLRGLGVAFYNIVVVMFGAGLLFYFLRSPQTLGEMRRRYPHVLFPLLFFALYYVGSIVCTGGYTANLRFFDFGFALLTVVLIGRDRDMLKVALAGLTLSACLAAVAVLKYLDPGSGDRPGSILVDGVAVGNPVAIGTPLALGFLALAVDRGRWLNVQRSPWLRLAVLLPTAMFLGLSTSRASWLVALGGLLVVFVFGRRQRLIMLAVIVLGVVALKLVLITPYGSTLQNAIDRTFDQDRSAANRTSGRSWQWEVAYLAFSDTPFRTLFGYGPGMGSRTYEQFADRVPGARMAQMQLHSLFMLIGVEAGLLGLVPLLGWLGYVLARSVRWTVRRRLLFPLICLLGYGFVVLTVLGNDTVSGAYLGIGLLSTLPDDI